MTDRISSTAECKKGTKSEGDQERKISQTGLSTFFIISHMRQIKPLTLIKLDVQEQFAALDGQPNEHPRATGSPPNRNRDSSNPITSVSERIRNRM